jgi:CHAT domain-containing protein/tetratricopeptide (TPR) repeat protein
MARKHTIISNKLEILIQFSFGLFISIFISFFFIYPSVATDKQLTSDQAQTLTNEGHEQLSKGNIYSALRSWEKATQFYRQISDNKRVTGSLINESLAFQYLGQYPRSCIKLTEALSLDTSICPDVFELKPSYNEVQARLIKSLANKTSSDVLLLGLKDLGDVLRELGQLEMSEFVLQQGLKIASTTPINYDIGNLYLSLANTSRTYFERSKSQYLLLDASDDQTDAFLNLTIQKAKLSLEIYKKVIFQSLSQSNVLYAKLNRLALLSDLDFWTTQETKFQNNKIKPLFNNIQSEILDLADELLNINLSSLDRFNRSTIEINLANSLLKINALYNFSIKPLGRDKDYAQLGLLHSLAAYQNATELGNRRIISASAGLSGKVYIALQNDDLAEVKFKDAISMAMSVEAWDLAYQWQYELAKLYKKQGKITAATLAYQSAVSSLESVRGDLISLNPDYQFSFSEKVEPIYKQYLSQLMELSSPNLDTILAVNEQYQSAEIENYLQCGKLSLLSIDNIDKKSSLASYFSIINLGEKYVVVFRDLDGKLHSHIASSKIIESNIEELRIALFNPNFKNISESSFQPSAQALYQELVKPFYSYIPKSGTLVFSLDSSLQNIPMTLLHDGKSYLVEQYNISLTMGSKIRQLKSIPVNRMRILLAGLSQASPSFELAQVPKYLQPLEMVKSEFSHIQKYASSVTTLLNEQFTTNRFTDALKFKPFSIVHISTHAQFSSDPQKTMILAWENVIGISDLRNLVRGKPGDEPGFDLLTLSACETAKGDRRSTLGLAGVAVQSGAKSTVASLWLVNDLSTSVLMESFYKYLNNGWTKTESLRQAQIDLMANTQYRHPYWWAPFVLIGSWI